jgi:hypothetical protein
MSGTRPLVKETEWLRPALVASAGKSWRQGMRQIAHVLTRSGSGSREDTMTMFRFASSIDPILRPPEEQP